MGTQRAWVPSSFPTSNLCSWYLQNCLLTKLMCFSLHTSYRGWTWQCWLRSSDFLKLIFKLAYKGMSPITTFSYIVCHYALSFPVLANAHPWAGFQTALLPARLSQHPIIFCFSLPFPVSRSALTHIFHFNLGSTYEIICCSDSGLCAYSELQLHPRDVPKGSIFWRYTCFIQTKFYFCREQDQEMQKLKMLHRKFQDYPLHPMSCQSVPSPQKPQVRTYRVSPPPRTSDSLWQCRRMFKITYNLLSAFKAVNSFMSASTMK